MNDPMSFKSPEFTNQRWNYPGFWASQAPFCILRQFISDDGKTVYVVTESEDNTGASITNCIEKIAQRLQVNHPANAGDFVLLEHYANRNRETLDLVTFEGPDYTRPRWTLTTPEAQGIGVDSTFEPIKGAIYLEIGDIVVTEAEMVLTSVGQDRGQGSYTLAFHKEADTDKPFRIYPGDMPRFADTQPAEWWAEGTWYDVDFDNRGTAENNPMYGRMYFVPEDDNC